MRLISLSLGVALLAPVPSVLSQQKSSPLLMGHGPARMPVSTKGNAKRKPIEGEFVLRQKYIENQYFRDEFHGWSTGEGMWRGLVGSTGAAQHPAFAAMKGTSNPEADFMALMEAGWLDRAQIAKGFEVKRRHDRLSRLARAKVLEAQKSNDPVALAKARVACADMDRVHYMEKKKLMAQVRKSLADRRPDLICSGPNCGAAGNGGPQGGVTRSPLGMMPPPPPMGAPY